MARVAATKNRVQPVDELSMEIAEYAQIKEQVDALSKRQRELRDRLLEAVEHLGEADDQGHLWMELPQSIDGVRMLQRQRRVTQSINQERAQELLDELGLLERCTTLVRVVDEDALMSAQFEGEITEDQMDSITDTKVVWALHLK